MAAAVARDGGELPPSRLIPPNPAFNRAPSGGILLNRLPPQPAPLTGRAKLKAAMKSLGGGSQASLVADDRSSSNSFRSRQGSDSASSTTTSPPSSPSIKFAPLPESGRKRANSITARASMLAGQRAQQSARQAAPAPVPISPPQQFSGSGEQGLYTIADLGKGISSKWSKLRGRKTSESSQTSQPPAVPNKAAEEAIEEEETTADGEKTPRRPSSPVGRMSRTTESDEEDDTQPMRRFASEGTPHAGLNKGSHNQAVYGYDPDKFPPMFGGFGEDEDARHHSFHRMKREQTPRGSAENLSYKREFWQANKDDKADSEDDASSGVRDDDDDDYTTGDESVASEIDQDHARSVAAAGIELFDRHR